VPAFLLLCERVCQFDSADILALRRDVKDMVACDKAPAWAGLLFERMVRARRPESASRYHQSVAWIANLFAWIVQVASHKVH
jgi:hypothetical protein